MNQTMKTIFGLFGRRPTPESRAATLGVMEVLEERRLLSVTRAELHIPVLTASGATGT